MRRVLEFCLVLMLVSGSSGAQQSDPTHQMIVHDVECYGQFLSLGDWSLFLVFIEAPDTAWAARTQWSPVDSTLERAAQITFEVSWLRAHPEMIGFVVRHEMFHVFLLDLLRLAYRTDRDQALAVSERAVQRMTAWPWWRGVCR